MFGPWGPPRHAGRPDSRGKVRAVIGLDLLDVDRLERALERRPNLADRLFTASEREYAASRARPGQHLAARFCAKEAVTKALQLDVMRPLDIEVLGGGSSAARVVLSGETARLAAGRGLGVTVSLTHTPTTAGAVAVATFAQGAPLPWASSPEAPSSGCEGTA